MIHTEDLSSAHRAHWLCIAYAFPPMNRSGTHRTLAFVKDLDRLGWDATVVTAEPDGEPLDESLLERIPASTAVVRIPWTDLIARMKGVWPWALRSRRDGDLSEASCRGKSRGRRPSPEWTGLENLRDWCSRWLVTPDSRIGWIGPAVRAGLRAIRHRPPEVIYSTSPYMSAHLAAMILARWCRLPWVADFRDPWRDNPFRDKGSWVVDSWDSLLEWSVLRSADRVICNTPTMTRQLCWRRPFVTPKSSTILNGFDTDLFQGVTPKRVASSDRFVLIHAGQFYGSRSPLVWFRAIRWALDRSPQLSEKLRVVLVGPEVFDGRRLEDIARAAGVHRNVAVVGQRTHRETLSYLAGSDALMLAGSAGSGSELQVPNKLFEYLAIRKPIIATCSTASPVAQILQDARAKAIVCRPDDEVALTDAIVRLATQGEKTLAGDWSGAGQFARIHRSNELLKIFRRVSRAHPTRTTQLMKPGEASVSTPRSYQRAPVRIEHPRSCRPSTGALRVPVLE